MPSSHDDAATSDDDGSSPNDPAAAPAEAGSAASRRGLLRTGGALALAALAGCSTTRSPTGSTASGTDPVVETETSPTTDDPGAGPSAPALRGPWPTAHADARNTGAVDAPGPQGPPALQWQGGVRLGTELSAESGPDGPVVTQRNGTVVAYDHDGAVRWRDRHDDDFVAAPVVAADGTVVVGTRDGRVTAYDADGDRRWERSTPDGLYAPHANDATPFSVDGDVVLLAHPRGSAYAFSLADGTERWRTSVPRRCHRPAVADGTVVLTSRGRRSGGDDESPLLALDATDGSEVWRTTVPGTVSIGAGVDGDAAYVGTIGGRVSAHAVGDGGERWVVHLDREERPWISSIPTAFADQVWVGTLGDGLYAVDADGVRAHVDVDAGTTPAVGDGRLYVGSADRDSGDAAANGSVVAVEQDGSVAWRTDIRGQPDGQVRYRDGRVVVGTHSGVVATLDATGTERWRAFERPASLPSPVVGDGALYCGNLHDAVSGYDVRKGRSHLWHVDLDGPTPGAPVSAGGTILAGSWSGEVAGTPPHEHADPPMGPMTKPERTTTAVHVDAPSPEPRWTVDLDGPVGDFGYGTPGDSETAAGTTVGGAFVGAGSRVVALTASGDVRWETDVGARVATSPAVFAGAVFATTTAGDLLSLGDSDGDVGWQATVGDAATAPVVVTETAPKLVVVGTDDGVVARHAADGHDAWNAPGPGRVRGAPALAADGTLVVADDAGVVRGLTVASGEERWRVEADGAVHGAPAIADGVAYVGTRGSRLLAIDVERGTLDWSYDAADWVDGSPVVAYGAVFAPTQAGTIDAVVADPE
ncbi:PQQ-binding-like beta-propeller repeat protein [Halorubellus sp. PRR65]|uniref:outer membrane protein assembly factor BamB family protein n=1 Tax=Halorubellus sp. PRR65 TaxID=3098148 RepID=UPI002B261C8C|nr:PQQ-binding-like beta-propeller repeat protein [Halorubellus sp. PRR65]